MKPRLLDWLACPVCAGALDVEVFAESEGEILDGTFTCSSCDRAFPIHRGVPRMGVNPPYPHPELEVATAAVRAGADANADDRLVQIKQATAASFGYEWTHFNRHGWDAKYAGETSEERRGIERSSFVRKALLRPGQLEGKLVLDAGCGNGRYLFQSAEMGAEVIGIDLSDAVDAAYANIGSHPRVHVVQGDLFQMPFPRFTFDHIFSIGVLMHTGDARRAFDQLVSRLKPGGDISVHVYRRGNRAYEWVDDRIRRRTVPMHSARLLRLSKRVEPLPRAIRATRRVTGGHELLYGLMNCFVRLETSYHNIFDWYSAPVATHHTYDEVFGWFRERGLHVVAHNNRAKDPLRRLLKSPAGGVTVRGRL
jgi:SAM-dependent methyltransferase/uncharacterized protein YbaR (Trm112 family)